MGEITADASAATGGVERRRGAVAAAWHMGDVLMNPGANLDDTLKICRQMADDGVGEGGKLVGLAVAAWQQVVEDFRRQILHEGQWRKRILIHAVGDLHAIPHGEMEVSRQDHHSLAEIAIDIGELDDGHLGPDVILLTHDPLRPAAAWPQHEDGWHDLHGMVFELTSGV